MSNGVRYTPTFALPSEYEQQAMEARRRRRMAEMLAQQAYQPQDVGVAPIPSAAPLVQGLQAFLAARQERKAEEAEEKAKKAGQKEFADYIRSFEPEERTVGVGDVAAMEAAMPQLDETGRLTHIAPSAVAAPNQRLMPAMTPTGEIDISQPMQMQVGGPLSMAQRRARALEGFESTNPMVQQFAQAQYAAATPQRQELKVGDIDPSKFTPQSIREAMQTGDYSKLKPVQEIDSLIGKPSPGDFTPASMAVFARTRNYADLVPNPKAAPVTNINLGDKGSQLAQELFLKDLAEQSKAVRGAESIINKLDEMTAATEEGTFTGSLAPGAVGAAQFLESFGVKIDPKVVSNTRAFEAASNQLVLDFMAANGGARGFTQEETRILQNAFPKIMDSPQARMQITELLRKRANETINNFNQSLDQFQSTYRDAVIPFKKVETAEQRYQRWLREQGKPK